MAPAGCPGGSAPQAWELVPSDAHLAWLLLGSCIVWVPESGVLSPSPPFSLQCTKARLKVTEKELKSLQWEHEVLEQRFIQASSRDAWVPGWVPGSGSWRSRGPPRSARLSVGGRPGSQRAVSGGERVVPTAVPWGSPLKRGGGLAP